MRSICKKGSVTLVAVLALCALAAASASASELYVGGKALTGTAALSQTPKVEGSITISDPSSKFKIVCKGINIENGGTKISELVAPAAVAVWNLAYENCKFTESKCEMREGDAPGEGPILDKQIEGTITKGTGSEDIMTIKYSPTGTMFGYFSSGGCALEGTDVLQFAAKKPSLALAMPTGQTESVEQTLTFPGEKEKIEFDGTPTYVSGAVKLKLTSGAKWSFH